MLSTEYRKISLCIEHTILSSSDVMPCTEDSNISLCIEHTILPSSDIISYPLFVHAIRKNINGFILIFYINININDTNPNH